jgi:ketosteroid isomerase-like protein
MRAARLGGSVVVVAIVAALVVALAGAYSRKVPGATSGDDNSASTAANAGIDAMNARLTAAYHDRDPRAYGALFTDSAVFEWPAVATVRGRPALEAMARESWPSLPEMELRLAVASRRIASDHATEFGAFEQSWRDSTGGRTTEFGRYVTLLARQPDESWRMDRFFGFSDSTRSTKR